MLGRRAGDAARDVAESANLVVTFPDVVELTQRLGRDADAAVRQKLARLFTYTELGRWNALRAKAEVERGGGQSLTSIGKVAQTRIMKLAAEIGLDVLGAAGTLAGDDGLEGGRFAEAFVFSPASSIYGGTDEIQRNIIAERSLGLPRDERPDKHLAFAEAQRQFGSGVER
jgi:alkylation response protein AidB-like acyl-CoA dehydrogenase